MSAALLIARRDLIDTLRDVRLFILACMTMGGVIGYSALSFEMSGMTGPGARDYFMVYAGVVFLLAIVPIPPLAAVSITRERHAGTLAQLSAAPVQPRDIILGKTLGATGVYAILLIMTLPLAGVVFFFTGIDWMQFLQVAVISSATAFTCAAMGVACSVRFHRTSRAVGMSFFWMLFLLGVPQFILGPFVFIIGIMFVMLLYTIISPVAAIVYSMTQGFGLAFFGAMVHMVLASLRAITFGVARLKREEYFVDREAEQQRYELWPRQLDTDARANLGNPMLAKTRRLSGLPGIGSALLMIVGSVLFVFAIAHAADTENIAVAGLMWLQGCLFILVLILPAYIALEVTREHENDTMDLLRTSLMTPWSMIYGQLFNALYNARFFLLAAGILFAPMLFTGLFRGTSPLLVLVAGLILTLLAVITTMVVAQAGALFSRKSSVALTLAYLFTIILLLGPEGGTILIGTMQGRNAAQTADALSLAAPIFATDSLRYPRDDTPTFGLGQAGSDLFLRESGDYPDLTSWLQGWATHVLVLLLASGLVLFLSTIHFTRRHWRDV